VKILLIHTYYNQKGGEDTVFQQEDTLLKQTEEVEVLNFQNHLSFFGGLQFLLSVWNIFVIRKIKKQIIKFQPDVIHIHNWHFALGPIVVRVAKKAGIPVVLTLHNYRLICPSATLLSKGSLFTDSLYASFPWKAVANKVYRDSFFLTFWMAFVVWWHKKTGTWKMVDKYIVLTNFAKDLFTRSSLGIAENKFVVKPNFVSTPEIKEEVRASHFLFIGRLSEDKGIKVLLEAFANNNYTLHIAGDGPLKQLVENAASQFKNIEYIGKLDKNGVENEMRRCTALLFPSIWYEGMPMTIIEAFSLGAPVLASNLGAMSTMIQDGYNGLHFETGNAVSLNEKISYWNKLNEEEKNIYRQNAINSFEKHYTNKKNKELLLQIYKDVIGKKHTN
jgi:glycosyltransferase involved in cell wall biosynthesis